MKGNTMVHNIFMFYVQAFHLLHPSCDKKLNFLIKILKM
jgi:hypothetical protein